jgi:hypothetical protein
LAELLRELLDGPEANSGWMLNTGDIGLLRSLDALSAARASAVPASGAASIAAHVDHVRYGLSLVNRWLGGERDPFATADWSVSWTRTSVDDRQWDALRQSLRAETGTLLETVRTPREFSVNKTKGIAAIVAHLAYHFGAIRQIDRAMRGPSAQADAATPPPPAGKGI